QRRDFARLLHRVRVIDAADRLRRSLELIAMMEIERQQLFLERREWLAGVDRARTELLDRGATDLDLVLQHRDRIRAVVPNRAERMRAADRTRMLIGNEQRR